jgi:hypothetical protein
VNPEPLLTNWEVLLFCVGIGLSAAILVGALWANGLDRQEKQRRAARKDSADYKSAAR